MPTICAAYECEEREKEKSDPSITFHRIPKDATRRQQWISAMGRENFTPHSSSRLCSKHFKPEDFDRTSLSYVRLRDNVVPSIFKASSSHPQDNQETSHGNGLMNTIKTEPVESDNVVPSIFESSSSHPQDNQETNHGNTLMNTIKTEPVESENVVPSIFDDSSSCLQDNQKYSHGIDPTKILKTELVESDDVLPSIFDDSSTCLQDNQKYSSHGNDSTETLMTKLVESENKLLQSKKKIKLLQQETRRLKKKNAKLSSIISALKGKQSLSVLESCAAGVSDLVKRQVARDT
ncbi:hypothetical protein Pcinc_027976 [Petrolisthes cinctipes]|uniref:THAP-type domain-containing protein n=1 Tax=Petrolisthes cinctipes TaxID=88211 RepID=A0AAE1K5Y8_PETCI|nr:hypothetical protein Pcinc_027976 [Petrolisthes cinctipes]